MLPVLLVFDALRTFDRPATRAELEVESGLDYDQVHKALRTLALHQLLIKDAVARQRGTYQLKPGAIRPVLKRGRYQRDDEHRLHMAQVKRAHRSEPRYTPARPPSHTAQAGALRTLAVELRATSPPSVIDSSPLARCWKKP